MWLNRQSGLNKMPTRRCLTSAESEGSQDNPPPSTDTILLANLTLILYAEQLPPN